MQIKSLYIKNFKAYSEKTISLNKDNLVIGENDSGKSSILEALNIFFNEEKIEKFYVRDQNEDVQIGIFVVEGEQKGFIKKSFRAKTFKLDEVVGDVSLIDGYSFVYIPATNGDIKKLISELAISKAINGISETTKNDLQQAVASAVNEVLSTIDGELMVVEAGTTSFNSDVQLKLDAAIKYEISTSGVPLEGRGSGFKKTVVYSLLTKGEYKNVIIGIDEIENSLSIRSACQLIGAFRNHFSQTIITTHSTSIMSCVNSKTVLPIINGSTSTVSALIASLGTTSDKTFVLVEGKTDMVWVNRVLELLGKQADYIVIQCGGHNNIRPVNEELIRKGVSTIAIKDGDAHDPECSLTRECIELYITLQEYNRLFGLTEGAVPLDKDTFFSRVKTRNPDYTDDSCKEIIADHVAEFLDLSNPLIHEIKHLLSID